MQIKNFFRNPGLIHQQMLNLTIELAEINSGSYNPAGIVKVSQLLQKEFAVLDGISEKIILPEQTEITKDGNLRKYELGPLLRIYKRPEAKIKVLLVGHMDTVFGVNHAFQQVTKLATNKINGPGVADMKGGIVILLEALRAFEQMPIARQLGWEILLTPDEEIGSVGSKNLLLERAKNYDIGLVYEPALNAQGTLAGQRKGSGDFTIVARGIAAHAGREFAKGKNAICALALIITAFNQLNGEREGVTINIGNIQGGDASNIVPDICVAWVNVRIQFNEDAKWLLSEFQRIIAEVGQQTGVIIELHGEFGKQPKHIVGKTARLYELVKIVGNELQQEITWQPTGGCCDGNNLSSAGLANVDTLGVCGGNIHCADEYLLTESLLERAMLSTGILARLVEVGPGLENF